VHIEDKLTSYSNINSQNQTSEKLSFLNKNGIALKKRILSRGI
jgi:hypothetical protein